MNRIIEKCPLFLGLSFKQILGLLESTQYIIKRYNKNEIIVAEGDECRSLMVLLSGSVKGEMVDFSGKTIKIEDIEPPRPLAPAFLFGNKNRYPVFIVTNEDIEILVMLKDSVIQLMQDNKTFLINYLNLMSNRAQFLSQKLKFLSFHSIKGKLAHYILQISKKQGHMVILDKSQNELAELFGVTRPSLGRAIRELHNDGIVSAEGKKIHILDQDQLSGFLK